MTKPNAWPSLHETVGRCTRRLRDAGIDTPDLDAQILIGHALGMDRAALLSQGHRPIRGDIQSIIDEVIERRAAREPVGRILGKREFWSMEFGLNDATLEPRPDSETLIDAALTLFSDRRAPLRFLDLGTGSGCLLLALLSEFPNATGLGTDIAQNAVKQATKNAAALNLTDRAMFRETNWSEGISETFDLVISNPPYIRSGDIAGLMPEVREHDPMQALDGGKDGLDAYRLIADLLPALLKPNGRAVFEVGQDQAQDVMKIFKSYKTQTRRDLAGVERCMIITT